MQNDQIILTGWLIRISWSITSDRKERTKIGYNKCTDKNIIGTILKSEHELTKYLSFQFAYPWRGRKRLKRRRSRARRWMASRSASRASSSVSVFASESRPCASPGVCSRRAAWSRGRKRCKRVRPRCCASKGWWCGCRNSCSKGPAAWSRSEIRDIIFPPVESSRTKRIQAERSIREGGGEEVTYQPFRGFYQRSVHPVHLVVKSARVAQIMSGPVPPPKRRRYCAAINALPAFAELKIHRGVWNNRRNSQQIPFQLAKIIGNSVQFLCYSLILIQRILINCYLVYFTRVKWLWLTLSLLL